jgi:polyisoprenoid-binding protein YceI
LPKQVYASAVNFWRHEAEKHSMNLPHHRPTRLFALAMLALASLRVLSALPQHAAPQTSSGELLLEIDPALSKVHWTLNTTFHTVHGTFALRKGAMRVDLATGKASGEIMVDATSGNSGNDGRDRKMHKEVLESSRYTDIVFRPDRVEGKIARQGTSTVQVHGMFVLHGSKHEMTVPVQAELNADHWTASSKFNVPFIDWGLKNPSTFLLKVNHAVQIELELKGRVKESGGS